ncbi:rhodanese-like domain-containing protein [Leucobacter sp. W1153]|uniref:rhodanese-like domain-containing protein n=1 Tax=unclassified Leucobacter TaxID=2621730 RepID=UPI003F3D5829
MIRTIVAAVGSLALIGSLAACSSNASEPVEIGANTVVLDVRSPDETASGYLEGAQILDFNSGEFAAKLPTLDPDAEYLVYCRSGNRAGQAIAMMEQNGITNVTNLGSLDQAASATGLPIVR